MYVDLFEVLEFHLVGEGVVPDPFQGGLGFLVLLHLHHLLHLGVFQKQEPNFGQLPQYLVLEPDIMFTMSNSI